MRQKAITKTGIAAILIIGSLPAWAAPIGVAAFTTPVQSFGSPTPTHTVSTPLTIGPITFTTPGGNNQLLWWQAGNGFNDCVGGCVTNSNSNTPLQLTLSSPDALAGVYVGQAASYTLNVGFYDAGNVLLGTVSATGNNGVSFAGWESGADKIASIIVSLPVTDLQVISVQSGYFETDVPEPVSLALLGTGLVGVAAVWRRKR